MADLFERESPESLGWKVPEPKPRKSILGGYSGRLSRPRITQDMIGEPIDIEVPAAEDTRDEPFKDAAKQLGAGIVEGVGSTVRGIGEEMVDPMRRAEDVSLVFKLARSLGLVPKPPADTPNPLEGQAARLEGAGKAIGDTVSPPTKAAIEGSTPDGDLTDPSSWTLGADPSLRGYLMQGVRVFGSMAPVVGAAIATKRLGAAGQAAATAGAGGAQGGGAAAKQARDTLAQMSDEQLEAESSRYRELLAERGDPAAARAALSREAEQWAHRMTFPVSAAGGVATGAIIGKPGEKLVERIGSRAGRAAALGGTSAAEEGVQEAAEGMATIAGMNRASGMDQPITEGSFQNFALGAIGGGGIGAVAGAFSASPQQKGAAPAEDEVGDEGTGLPAGERPLPADWEVVDDLPATTQPARGPGPEFSGFDRQLEQGQPLLPASGEAPGGPGPGGPTAGGGGPGAFIEGPTQAQMAQRAASPDVLANAGRQVMPTDVLSRFGTPFMLRSSAEAEAARTGGEVVEVDDGFVVRPEQSDAGSGRDGADVGSAVGAAVPQPASGLPGGQGIPALTGQPGSGGPLDVPGVGADGVPGAAMPGDVATPGTGGVRPRGSAPAVAPGPARRTREQAAAARKRAYRDANPFRAFLGEFGVHTSERSDAGGDPRRPVMIPYHGALFRNSGMRLDELARRAQEAGFLTQADIDSEFDNGGVNKLADMIRRELAGERIMPVSDAESTEEAQWREQSDAYWEAMAEAEAAIAALTDDEINALLQIASDEDAEVRNEEIDIALEPGDAQESGAGAQEGAAGLETGGDSAGGAAARDQGSAEVGFDLTAPTPDQFRREATDAEAQARREGAPPPEDFTLTGSSRTVDQTAARGQMDLAPAPETATTFQWKPLTEGERANDRWEGSMRRGFEPNAYQQAIMDAVRAALDAGKFYSDEVRDFVADRLGVTPEQRALNKTRVEGGDFGYEVYLARKVVEARSKDAKLQEATRELNLKPGDKLGTLVFNNDFKRNTGMTVVSVDGDTVVLDGKRGAQAIRQTTDSLGVKAGIDRAKEKGYRPDSADEFIAGRKRGPSLTQRTESALTEKKAEQQHTGIGRDGRTEADRADATLRSNAAELAGQFAAEVKEDDFDPAEARPALEAWAKQANVPADDLRQAVLKRIADNDGLSASHKKRIADALSPTKAAAQAEKSSTRVTRDSDLADGATIYDGQGKPYRVHYQRNDLVVAHPIVDGKAQVSADTSVRFWVNPDRPASGENDRTDPIYTAPRGTLVSRANAALKSKIEDVGEKIGGARKDLASPTGQRKTKVEDEAPGWRKRYDVSQIAKSTAAAEEGRWVIYDKRQKDRLGQPKQVGRDTFPTKEAAEAAIPLAEVARNHRVTLASTTKGAPDAYEITRMVTDRKRVKVVNLQFATREDATRYMVEHAVEIIETKTSFGEEILPAPDTVRRTGPVRRQGDATAEQFKDTFGFRAVEFGNWNSQEERQEVMNHAFDGLADLAEVLGIPTRAIGLNGELALAFGARGSGLTGARAHYEPDYSVINLTKMRGAGSLAHEWLHALDHYLGRQDGKASSERVKNNRGDTVFKTHSPEGDMASHGFKYRDSGVRPEIREAYAALIETMYRKAEQYVEDTHAADRFVGKAREDVQKHLGRIRDDLATKLTYRTRKNAPASAEQLAAFDEIARKIVDGEAIETKVMPAGKSGVRWSNDALEALSRIIKDVRGHSGFLATRDGTLDRLRAEMEHYSQRLKMLAQAQSAEVKTKKVPTSFAMAAKSIDQGRASDYWSTQHEMAARAFQSYVLDKIAERGNTSDFLTYGTENLVVPTPWGWQRPFPAGDERKAVNAAFDKLVATLQTRETDKGVMLFSRRRVTLPDATIGATLGDAARHPDYAAAKAGDPAAAARLVRDLVTDEFVEKVRKAIGEAKPIIQPVVSVEAAGRNKIPAALAEMLAMRMGFEAGTGIGQATVTKRTGMGGLDRLMGSPEFVGQVRRGADYLLVDDTLTQGGTFAALAGFVEDGGGRVIGAVALTGKQYSAKLALSDTLLEQVREKFGDIEEAFRAATGHGFDSLTESEARYLVSHDAPDAIRDRVLAQGRSGGAQGHPLRSGRLDRTDIAAHAAATSPLNDHPEPSEAQKDAGNYPKGHLRVAGLDISIENPAGSHRRPEWPALPAHYGYFRRSEGKDGDQVDVFVREGTPEDFDGPVFVIDQNKADGSFDEHKVMLGWRTQVGAARAYRAAFTKGWKGLGAITRATLDDFKAWLASGRTKRRFADAVDAAWARAQDVSRGTAGQSHRDAVEALRAALRAEAGGDPSLEHGIDGLRAAQVPDALAAHAARALGRMFGVDVVFVAGDEKLAGRFQFNGIYIGGRRVFVSTTATDPFHQVVGHEFLHHLKRSNPDLYDEFVDAARPYLNARAANAYAVERSDDPNLAGRSEAVRRAGGWEETFADTWGAAWRDPAFWQSLAARERSLFRRIVAKWKAFVLRIRMALAGDRESPKVKALYSDFDAVRDIIADITARAAESEAGTGEADLMRSANRNPVFYSELERQIDAINAKSQPAQSWIQQIDSLTKKGVKPDEIEWSGVKEWLALQQGKVTKDAVLKYLVANGVRVEETILGESWTERAEMERLAREAMWADGIDNPTDEELADFIAEHGYDLMDTREGRGPGEPKFGTYRVPGQAENYRELLLTLPQKVIEPDAANNARIAEGRKAVFDHYEPQIAELDRRIDVARDAGSRGEYNRLWEQRNSLIDERDATAARKAGVIHKSRIEPVKFQSNHWNQPNVLAHVRIDERTDTDGKRVLFVNEIQSDWAQAGRKLGFSTPEAKRRAELAALGRAEINRRLNEILDKFDAANLSDLPDGADKDLAIELYVAGSDAAVATRAESYKPLLAPFVGKTEAWVALALKRMIRYAVDNGFDRVALVNGEQAADMFDLGSQIDSLGWRANGDGTVRITGGYSRDGAVSNRTFGDYPVEKLPEVVGKDLAEKIRAAIAGGAEANKDDVALLARHGIKHRPDVADYAFETPEGLLTADEFSDNGVKAGPDVVAAAKRIQAASAKNGGVFSGLDLRVGDHGMRGFYDQIVPKVLKDVLKKVGGPALTTVDVYTPARAPGSVNEQGIVIGPDGERSRMAEQPGFDITPALRERAARGMPMFSRRQAAASPPPTDPRVGPIDTLLRGVGGKALSEKLLRPIYDRLIRAAGRATPEAVKQGLVSDYGLDEPYMDVRDATRAAINKQLRGAKSIIDLLAGLDREQSRVAYQWMTERPDAAAERAMMDALPEDSRAVMQRMKEMVHELGRAAVRAGLLSEEAFERNEYAYLHRSYTKHEAESTGADGVHWKARAKIRAETFKGRGLRHDIDQDRLMRYADEVTAGDKFTRFERRRADGKLAEVRYVPVGKPMPPELAGWRNDGVWEARWMGKPTATKVGMYRDFTKAERERMGEIEEVRYAFAKTVLHAVKDIEHAKFLRWVANEYGRDPEALEAAGETVHDGKSGYINLRTYAPDEWVKVPSTKIPGTNLRAYGELAGKAVPAAIWNDIRSTFGSRPETMPGKVYDWTLRAWKLSKTAMSPAVHMNNVMANVILADLADIRVTDMVEAFRVLRAAKQGDAAAKAFIARYEDSGAEQGSLVAQELRLEAIEPMLADLLQEADRDLGMVKVSQLLSMAAHGDVAAALRGLKSKRAVKAAAIPFKKLVDAYHMEDSVFRLAAFIRHTKDGMSDLKAGQVARDAFLNYDINAPWINALRRGPLPFIAFSYRAIPMLMKAAIDKPWKIAKYAGIASVLNSAAYMMLGLGGDDERRERALLPEEKSGRVFGIFPRLMRMPWNDEHGAPVFLDVRRWLPAGDVFDVQQSQSTVPLPGWLTASGPLGLFMEMMLNKSSFTGNPIVLETDTTGEAMAKVADHLFKFMTPNLPIPNPLGWVADRSMAVPGLWQTYSFTSLQNAGSGVTDAFGRERSLGQAAAAAVGVKLGSYPTDVMQMHEGIRYRQNADEIRKQVRSIMRQQSRGALDPDEAQTKIEAQREKLRRINERLREKLEAAR